MTRLLKVYRDFSSGLSEAANDNMRDNELLEAQNSVPGERYGIAKAQGVSTALPRFEQGEVLELLSFKPQSGEAQTLLFSADSLYKLVSGAWQLVTSGLDPIADWFIAQGKLWFLDGTAYRVYDGASCSLVSFTPQTPGSPTADETAYWARISACTMVVQRGSRWFFARAGQNQLYFSNVGDPTSFTTTSVIDVNTRDADGITALREFADGVTVFKPRAVFYLSGWDFVGGTDITLTRLNASCGAAYGKSVQQVDNALLYMSAQGLYRLSISNLAGFIACDNLSDGKLNGAIADFAPQNACAMVSGGVYHLLLQKTGQSCEYRYYPQQNAFFGPFSQKISCYSQGTGADLLICPNGYLLRYDEDSCNYLNTADGKAQPITMRAVTKAFDLSGKLVSACRISRFYLTARQYLAQSSCPKITLIADYGRAAFELDLDESLIYGEGDWGDTRYGFISTVSKEAQISCRARRVQFCIENSAADQPVLIYGLGLRFKEKSAKAAREGVTAAAVDYDS